MLTDMAEEGMYDTLSKQVLVKLKHESYIKYLDLNRFRFHGQSLRLCLAVSSIKQTEKPVEREDLRKQRILWDFDAG